MADPATLRELPPPLLLNLRGDAGAEAFRSAASGALGVAPPVEPNTVASRGEISVLWLGPDEWLVTAPSESAGELTERLGAALSDLHHSLIDASAGRIVLELEGVEARAVLAQGLSLDLRPRAFGPGRCAQTGLARVPVILQQIDATPRFRVFVRASFAPYVTEWLKSTIAELA
ncbi:MAG TPA: sarcosine oxidase subunit gamma family protein [Stellaceae bacterium]|nr:sarcosine oxidase subunit gamma family protein [Stellaceae bacterium]